VTIVGEREKSGKGENGKRKSEGDGKVETMKAE
jgi:hypothetical protein